MDKERLRQKPAPVPLFLTRINRPTVEKLAWELEKTPFQERLNLAVQVFSRLVELEGRDCDRWTLEYLNACQDGPESRRHFLIEQGVFSGGDYLYRPPEVIPGMEIANLNPNQYVGSLRDDVETLIYQFFWEYSAVKNSLAFPEFSDLSSTPKLKTSSFLLKDYTREVLRQARMVEGPPLLGIFGPGMGEETIEFIRKGYSVLALDIFDKTDLLRKAFDQAKVAQPEVFNISNGQGDIDIDRIRRWSQTNYQPTIFFCSGIDFSNEDSIPRVLCKLTRVSSSLYVLHEIPPSGKNAFLNNMDKVSKGPIIIFDGLSTPEALDNVVLPVSDALNVPLAGHGAVVTYLLSNPPDVVKNQVKLAVPRRHWKVEVVNVPLPPPLLYPLQVVAKGN